MAHITYDWSSIEASLDSGDNTAQDELNALQHLFTQRRKRKNAERIANDKLARIKALKDAEPNTPIYYKGATPDLWGKNLECMLKSGDGRTRMKVQVKSKGGQFREWTIPYESISLDYRDQTDHIDRTAGFSLQFRMSEKKW
jgi:hypothetical protein